MISDFFHVINILFARLFVLFFEFSSKKLEKKKKTRIFYKLERVTKITRYTNKILSILLCHAVYTVGSHCLYGCVTLYVSTKVGCRVGRR